eukprot:3140329-Rhodomonas_salina.3
MFDADVGCSASRLYCPPLAAPPQRGTTWAWLSPRPTASSSSSGASVRSPLLCSSASRVLAAAEPGSCVCACVCVCVFACVCARACLCVTALASRSPRGRAQRLLGVRHRQAGSMPARAVAMRCYAMRCKAMRGDAMR